MLSSKSSVIRLDTVKCFLQWANKLDYWEAPKLFYSDRGYRRMARRKGVGSTVGVTEAANDRSRCRRTISNFFGG